jgi:Cu/Ag efflux pump CusA
MKKELMLSIIQKRWVMLCLFVMMCIFGYYSWKQLSIEAYPDIADGGHSSSRTGCGGSGTADNHSFGTRY